MNTDVCLGIPGLAQTIPVSELADEAKRNGWQRCAVIGAEPVEGIISCVRLHAASAKELQSGLKGVSKDSVVIVDAGENSFNWFALMQPKVAFLAGFENLPKNGFDHITAKLAAGKNVGIVIELAVIIDYHTRRNALKEYADILALQRKYKFPLVIASGAREKSGIRNLHETVALCSLFGMTRSEVYAALEAPAAVLSPRQTVETEA